MKHVLKTMLLLSAALALPGCVIVVGTGAEDGAYWGAGDYSENGVRHDGDHLSRDVARTLGTDADLVAEDIRVSSEDGTVVLKGRVDDVALIERAITATRGVAGVEHVVSRLVVEAG